MTKNIYFVSGIDTDIGKSYATGHLAKIMARDPHAGRVITMKMVETGVSEGHGSADIALHRSIMEIPLQEVDLNRLTSPQLFTTPCSPHLAAELEGKEVDLSAIEMAIDTVAQQYDTIIIEGAGGLMVPLTHEMLTIDFVAQRNYPVVLVTSPRLGSLNHTLLSLEALQKRGIELHALVYNTFEQSSPHITADTLKYLTQYLKAKSPQTKIITLGELNA